MSVFDFLSYLDRHHLNTLFVTLDLLPLCNIGLAPLARFSSVQLLGDLLFHISGVTGKMTTETASEDDNFGTAQSNKVKLLLSSVPFSKMIFLF